MNASLFLDNLFAWSAQISVLVAAGALAALALSHPRARLIFWQGIFAIALLLPAVEPWHRPMLEETGSVTISPAAAPVMMVHKPTFHFAWRREYLLVLIATGAAFRFLWIGAGLVRLRRHRLDARMLTIPPVPFSNPRVRWFLSTTVGGPVTFGFLSPSILLPARVTELDDDLRAAIAHHELAHVRRRDWLFVLFEESIRSLLWFHPAIWFILSRVQLAREQVVDAEVVGLTRDRERYLDALIAVAAQRLLPDVAPAPLFLKKRQLAVRVAAVLKETRMSRPRTFLSYTTVCSAAIIAIRLAVWMFPMQAPAQTVMNVTPNYRTVTGDGPGVTVEPGAKILHRSSIFFPPGSPSGTVVVESSVNAKGEVTDARVVSGPDELRRAVLINVLTWHFSPDGGLPPTIQTTIRFEATPQAAKASAAPAVRAGAAPSSHTPSWILKSIETPGLSDELAEQVRASLPVHVGDPLGAEEFDHVSAAIAKLDEHLTVQMNGTAPDATLIISLWANTRETFVSSRTASQPAATAATPPVAATAPTGGAATPPERIRVGGNVQAANLIKKITPLYPPLAKQAGIQGIVRFTTLIGKDGSILSLQLVEGHPLLVEAAREAVSQWQYKPTLLNGSPVEVITQIDVNFTLTQ